jgi:hypothetical protein
MKISYRNSEEVGIRKKYEQAFVGRDAITRKI